MFRSTESDHSPHRARVHAHLQNSAGFPVVAPLTELGYEVEFVHPDSLVELDDNGDPVLLPATTEAQAETVRMLREDFGCCISPVIAIVNDCNGHQTYTAIKSGATSVVNLAISAEAPVNALQAALTAAHTPALMAVPTPCEAPPGQAPPGQAATPGTPGLVRMIPRRPRGGGDTDGAAGEQDSQLLADEEAEALVNLLCTDETVGAIARKFFCSERTMYRKIRNLYDRLQVSGRSELRSLVAVRYTAPGLRVPDGA